MGNAESRASEDIARRNSVPTSADAAHTTDTNRQTSRSVGSIQEQEELETADEATSPTEQGGIEQGPRAAQEASNNLGYWYLLKNGFSDLVNLIIRPPRAKYDLSDLGPAAFHYGGQAFVRQDFQIVNSRNQKLECSHWKPEMTVTSNVMLPCVVYLHGNSSCRLEALSILRTCLASGITVVAFDCSGSGMSDGEYISLGYFEREDLKCVTDHLRDKENVGPIGLWGRSMGAATALLHVDRDPSIAAVVSDSAFTNLETLILDIVERGREEGYTIPLFIVKLVVRFMRNAIMKKAGFDIKKLSPISHAAESFVPALFIAAKNDDFIRIKHSQQLCAQYAGDHNLIAVSGDHNSVRPQFVMDSAGIFLQATLQMGNWNNPNELASPAVTDPLDFGEDAPWSSRSMAQASPAARARMLLEFDAGLSEKALPQEEWSCPACTFVNRPRRLQCEMCQSVYDGEVEEAPASAPAAVETERRQEECI